MKKTIRIPQATKSGYAECVVGGVFDWNYPESKTRRGRVQDNGNICPTITAEGRELYVIECCELCDKDENVCRKTATT